MKVYGAIAIVAVALAGVPNASFAAEGANTGSGTSTPAGPAGDNQGPSKMSNPAAGGAMKNGAASAPSAAGGTGMTSGRGGDSSAGGGSRNGDHGN